MKSETAQGSYIGDIAKLLGISQRSIRYYEELGLIKPLRTEGGFRMYAEAQVERLRTVLLLKELGMTLEEIQSLIKLWHEGTPAEVTPKMRETLCARLNQFEMMIEKYRLGIEQLNQVLKLLNLCGSCGHQAEETACTTCITEHNEKMPDLLKTLL